MNQAMAGYALAALFGAALVALLVTRWLSRALRRRRARLRSRRAALGERDAVRLLERLGYAVEAEQAPAVWTIACDGQAHDISLRADLIVSRGRERYVAEVKTGAQAPRVTTASTRRQLLEYRVAYDVDGVLLVDAEVGRVLAVEFPLPHATRPGSSRARAMVFVAGLLIGAAAASIVATLAM